MNKFLRLFLLLTTFLFFALPSNAMVKISPERFELNVNKEKRYLTSFFTVKIDGNEPVRYKVYTDYFEISDKGTMLSGLKNSAENSLVDKIRFNPKEVTVYPGKVQKIRFTIIGLDSLPDGESRVVIFLEEAKTRKHTLRDANNNIAASINLKTRIAIPIYVDKGNVRKNAEISSLVLSDKDEKLYYELMVKSKGNSKVRVEGNALIMKDKELLYEFPIDTRPIQSGTESEFINVIPTDKLVKGNNYLLKFNLKYLNEDNKTKYITDKLDFTY